jgi:hypothetical protein
VSQLALLRLEESFRTGLGIAAAAYNRSLLEGYSPASNYLQSRGIDADMIVNYRLGVVNGSQPEHEQYTGMLCIPYETGLGGVVSLKFRRPHDCTAECEHSKYISPYPTRLFNTPALNRADELGYVFLCEGEIDAILLDSCGFPAVAVPGVESWQAHPEWVSVLSGYARVLVPFDRDEAGRRFFEAVRRDFRPGAVVPAGLPGEDRGAADIGDAYRICGRDEFTDYYARITERG